MSDTFVATVQAFGPHVFMYPTFSGDVLQAFVADPSLNIVIEDHRKRTVTAIKQISLGKRDATRFARTFAGMAKVRVEFKWGKPCKIVLEDTPLSKSKAGLVIAQLETNEVPLFDEKWLWFKQLKNAKECVYIARIKN